MPSPARSQRLSDGDLQDEHEAVWKDVNYGPIKQYPDFKFSNTWNSSCLLPDFWNQDGTPVTAVSDPDEPTAHNRASDRGCYESEFDHYGGALLTSWGGKSAS